MDRRPGLILMESIESIKKQNAALIQDIKALRSSAVHERFRIIFDNSRLANKIITSDLKILQIDMAMVRLLGYDNKEDIIGTHILDYSPPEYHGHWGELQKSLWNNETPFFSLDTFLIRKDKTFIWCRITSIGFSDEEGLLGYTIIEDLTEQQELKLHKEQFISIASHELKTPMTSLQANLQLMNRMLDSETMVTDKLKKMAQNAEKHIIKLNYLINDLLSSTKIEQGQLSLNKTTFRIKELVDNCCSHIRLEDKYYINYRGSDTLTLFADHRKLDQVLVNLVNNAVKYAPESFEITVDAEDIKGVTRISVTDKGKGIAPEHLKDLFERYFRLSKENNHTTGLGLGLYICAEIVRLHGGEMGVESKLGKGATFWFTIPGYAGATS